MIEVTERAKKELELLLRDNVDVPQACLRLKINDEGKLGLGIDIAMSDDEVVEHEGSTLLVVEQELADQLNDIAIDIEETDEGKQLVIVEKSS